jgi:hypothetical protein
MSAKEIRRSLAVDLGNVKGVNQMAVQRDYNKPLHEEEPYLVQVPPPLPRSEADGRIVSPRMLMRRH